MNICVISRTLNCSPLCWDPSQFCWDEEGGAWLYTLGNPMDLQAQLGNVKSLGRPEMSFSLSSWLLQQSWHLTLSFAVICSNFGINASLEEGVSGPGLNAWRGCTSPEMGFYHGVLRLSASLIFKPRCEISRSFSTIKLGPNTLFYYFLILWPWASFYSFLGPQVVLV